MALLVFGLILASGFVMAQEIVEDVSDVSVFEAEEDEEIKEDKSYKVFTQPPIIANGSQSKYLYNPFFLMLVVNEFQPDIIHIEQEAHDLVLLQVTLLNNLFWHKPIVAFMWENISRGYSVFSGVARKYNLKKMKYNVFRKKI